MREEQIVLLTGGTGYLGSALVPILIERGHEVHAIVRPGADRSHLDGCDVTWCEADLEEPAGLERAAEAVARRAYDLDLPASVLHAGALISYRTRDAEQARRVNVEGTRRVLDAAQTAGIGRVLLVSSVVAVGHAADDRHELDERAPFNGASLRSHYVTTKRAAEDFALAVKGQLQVVVASPGAIFGPSPRRSNTTEFLRRFARGEMGPFAPPGSLGVVGLEDAALGTVLALERGRPGRRYLLSESNWTVAELCAQAARALGCSAPRWRLPSVLWSLVVGAVGLADRVRPAEIVTPQSLRLLGAHFRFDATRAREELGWTPRPFPEVLAETAAWMRAGEGGSSLPSPVEATQGTP